MRRIFSRLLGASPAKPKLEYLPSRDTVPYETRVYAIGDVHGRFDLLEQLFAKIERHINEWPIWKPVIIMLGDYVDRGPKSKEVLDLIIGASRKYNVITICGNHEHYMLEAFNDNAAAVRWMAAGGRETLHSYGVSTPGTINKHTVGTFMSQASERIPSAHLTFLRSLSHYAMVGDYAFVHAGIKPGIPIEQQSLDDLITIREPFLSYRGPHDYMIVHGHTPVDAPEFQINRINIDTGAYITGRLSCLVLEGSNRSIF